jgi:hypothetical protein
MPYSGSRALSCGNSTGRPIEVYTCRVGRGKRRQHLRLVEPTPAGQASEALPRRSLLSLEMFDDWCRSYAAFALARGYGPGMVFWDEPDLPEPSGEWWELDCDVDDYPSVQENVDEVVREWLEEHRASQIGVCVPIGGADDPYLLLVVCDETGVRAAAAPVAGFAGLGFLGSWVPTEIEGLPVAEWQELLAKNLAAERHPSTERRLPLRLVE